MAVGNLIYVGKSRLRRKFRQQKIENRLKRQERRRSQRLEKERLSRSSGDYEQLDSTGKDGEKGHANTNNGIYIEDKYEENHCCKFCDDYNSFDCVSVCSGSSSADSEELLPLIETSSPKTVYSKVPGMPFGPFGRKSDRKSPPVAVIEPVEEAKAAEPEPEPLRPEAKQGDEADDTGNEDNAPGLEEKPLLPADSSDERDDVMEKLTLLQQVEKRLKEKEKQLKELEEKYDSEKQKLEKEAVGGVEKKGVNKTVDTNPFETNEGELNQSIEEEEQGIPPKTGSEKAEVAKRRRLFPHLKKQQTESGCMLCCTIM